MKKIIPIIILITLVLTLTACIDSGDFALDKPNVRVSADKSYIEWDEVKNAVYYEVIFNNDNPVIVRNKCKFDITKGGKYPISVRAIGDGLIYSNSEITTITSDFKIKKGFPKITYFKDDSSESADYLVIKWTENSDFNTNIIYNSKTNTIKGEYKYKILLTKKQVYNVKIQFISKNEEFANSDIYQINFNYKEPKKAEFLDVTSKIFDKKYSESLMFSLNMNDDIYYSLSKKVKKQDSEEESFELIKINNVNYKVLDNKLIINNTYLDSLDNGEYVFVFKTKHMTQEIKIKIIDTRIPRLVHNAINYNIASTYGDISIAYLPSEGYNFESLYINNNELTNNYNYEIGTNKVILKRISFINYGVGNHNVVLKFKNGNDVASLKFDLNVISTDLPYILLPNIKYDLNCNKDLSVNLTLNNHQVTKVKGILSDSDYTINSASNNVIFNKNYLKTLSVGTHLFNIVTDVNIIPIKIEISNSSTDCYNLKIDVNKKDNYLYVTWDCDSNVDKYNIKINNQLASSSISGKFYKITNYTQNENVNIKIKCITSGNWAEINWTPASNSSEFLNKHYEFFGETKDYYIENMAELVDFVNYAVFDRSGEVYDNKFDNKNTPEIEYTYNKEYDKILVSFSDGGNFSSGDNSLLVQAMDKIKIKGSYSISTTSFGNNVYKLTIIFKSDEQPEKKTEGNNIIETGFYPSQIDDLKGTQVRTDVYNQFGINNISKTQTVKTSEQLFAVVNAGVRPIPESFSRADIIYKRAKNILRDIITDDMSDATKLLCIYDYLITNVVYDHVLKDIYNDQNHPDHNNLSSFNSFYLEGVFFDKVAVCDGIAKAFVLLARIEGIEAIKVSGIVGNVNHAWNKVKVDGKWYIVDCTWGNYGNTEKEYLTHAYFMVSDQDLMKTHKELDIYPVAQENYNYFKKKEYAQGKDFYIDNKYEFEDMIDNVVKSSGVTYIEFYNNSGLSVYIMMNYADVNYISYQKIENINGHITLLKIVK